MSVGVYLFLAQPKVTGNSEEGLLEGLGLLERTSPPIPPQNQALSPTA